MKSLRQLQQQFGNSVRWSSAPYTTEQCCHCLGTGTLPAAQCYVSRGAPILGGSSVGGLASGSAATVPRGGFYPGVSPYLNRVKVDQSASAQRQQQQHQCHQRQHWQALSEGGSSRSAGLPAAPLTSESAKRLKSSVWHLPGGRALLTILTGSTALVGCGYCIGNASADSGHPSNTNGGPGDSTWDLPSALLPSSQKSHARQAISASSLSPFFIADAAAKVSPAVVNIRVRHLGQAADSSTNGSGFIISSEGVVVTNTHIVSDAISVEDGGSGGGEGGCPGADLSSNTVISVTLQDGRCLAARLLNYDWASDLAVLRIEPQGGPSLPVASLGTSGDLRAGEWVVALGSPLHLANSVSAGIVSAVRRGGADLGLPPSAEFIQTDAACNPGSSGGPLVNVQGEVIGISNMKAVAADGVSFAIPIDSARLIIDQLMGSAKQAPQPHLGAKTVHLSRQAAAVVAAEARASFPVDQPPGLYVSFVEAGGPAGRGGLRAGDTITGWGGHEEVSTLKLEEAVRCHVGQPLKLSVSRSTGGPIEIISVQPVLRKRPS